MYCKNCGAKLSDDMMFCPDCGSPKGNTEGFATLEKTGEVYKDEISAQDPMDKTQTAFVGSESNSNNPYNNTGNENRESSFDSSYNDNFQSYNENSGDSAVKSKDSVGTAAKVLSIFLAFLFFATTLYSVFVGIIRLSFSEKSLNEAFENLTVSDIKIKQDNEQRPISDFIYDMIDDAVTENYNISVRKISQLLDKEEVKEFALYVSQNILGYLINGRRSDNFSYLDKEEIIDFIKSIEDDIYDSVGYRFTQKDYDYIRNELEYGSLSFLTSGGKDSSLPLDILSLFVSMPVMIAMIALSLIFAVLILFLNKWKIKKLIIYLGIPITIVGVLLLISSLAMLIVLAFGFLSFIEMFIAPFVSLSALFGSVAFAVGLIMIIIYSLIFRKRRVE